MQWACSICGYIHDEGELPSLCPVCGAPRSKFAERYEDDDLALEDEPHLRRRKRVDDYYGDYDE